MIRRIIRKAGLFMHHPLRTIFASGEPSPAEPSGPVRAPASTPSPSAEGRFRGQSAVIVGAGPNIGLAIARELASEGASLLLTNNASTALEAVVTALHSEGWNARSMVTDVSDPDSVPNLLRTLDAADITPDLLVLNAGMHSARWTAPREEMDRVFSTNLLGPMDLARRVAERMQDRRVQGSIVFVSSIHSSSILGDWSYTGSKAALEMMCRELALHLAPSGIRVNAVAPGWVALGPDGSPRPHRHTPLYRSSVPPACIGKAVSFLADSALSGYTTGTTLTVDGGLSLVNYMAAMWSPRDLR